MSQVYDNWERLVRATLRREKLRLIALRTPTPSDLSSASSCSSSFKLPSFLVGEAFDYDQILRASKCFKDSNLIIHGLFVNRFRGVLDNGTPVVIKKIDLSRTIEGLELELEFYGKVSHPRFVPLIGQCLDNSNYKFLVYKYMSNRDLGSLFFREIDTDEYTLRMLDWITRLKIAIGVAEALCYLHHECFPPLVHRYVRASSILLDDKYEARLGSLFAVCGQVEAGPSSKGTSGTPNATCAYDVYCFGMVLLQLVTGKLDIIAFDNVALKHDWLGQKLPYISIDDKELVRNIVDPCLIIDEDQLVEVWAMAIVARSCLNPKPSRRPQMRNVLKALKSPLKVVRKSTLTRHSAWQDELLQKLLMLYLEI